MAVFGECLVIGGCGWTGSFVVGLLVKLSDQLGISTVHAADIHAPDDMFRDMHRGAIYQYCDISDAAEVKRLVDKVNPRVVFHLASVIDLRPHPSPSVEAVNVNGTKNIISAMRSAIEGDSRSFLVYTSSIDVVSETWGANEADESTAYATPSNDYKRTKIMAEQIVLQADSDKLRTTALRPGHIFGPGDHIIKYVLESPVGLGPQESKMSFVYVQNCALCHILAALALIKESTTTTNSSISSNIQVRGSAFFVTDFDKNFSDAYCLLGGRSPVSARLPWWIVVMIVFTAEVIEHICYFFFNTSFQHPVTGISRGLLEACDNLTARGEKAKRVLGYGRMKNHKKVENDNDLTDLECIDFEECVLRTKYFVDTGEVLFS